MDTSKKSLAEQVEEQLKEQAEARRCVEARIGAQNDYLAMMKESNIDKMLEDERIGVLKNRRKLKGKEVAVAPRSVNRPNKVVEAPKNPKLLNDAQKDFINNYLNK